MQFRILGSIEIGADDDVRPLPGTKARVLLTALLLRPNEPVSSERLALALWGEDVPQDAVAAVRVTVSRLRSALGDPGALVSTPAGYRLRVRPGELDVERFEVALAQGRTALRAGRHADARSQLQDALNEWRGPALGDMAAEPFARDEAARLEELHLEALEGRLEADLALGHHAEVVGELRSLSLAHPLRERLHGLLMLALYRSGRQAEALDVYQRVRLALVEQLGLEPGPELRALQRAVLEQSVAVAAPAPQPALPSAIAREVRDGVCVGREPALALLRRRWARAQAGERQFVLLSGEPGIGKTRLASTFAAELHAAGATALHGRSEPGALVPYQPFVSAVEHYVAHRETLEFDVDLDPELRELARFVPALRRHVEPPLGDEPDSRYRLFAAVTRVLAAAARERPAVLVLDDLHWADRSTVLLLGHLLSDPEPIRLLVLATARDEGAPELLGRAYGEDAYQRLALGGLDADATAALAGDLGAPVAQRLHAETGGNPFFVTELLRALSERLPEAAGAGAVEDALGEIGVPEGVKQLIEQRIARLSETAARLLRTGAVVGPEFRLEVVERLLDASEEEFVSAVEGAVAAGLLSEAPDDVDRLRFSHALVREAVYESLTRTRRVRAHRRIAEALEVLGAPPAQLAHHFLEGGHDAAKAAEYAERAAREAMEALAYEEAATHYRQALRVAAEDPERRCALLLGLGAAELRAGMQEARATLREAAALARRQGLPQQLAEAALGFAHRNLDASRTDAEAVALLEASSAALGASDSPLKVRVLARLANVLHFQHEPARTDELSTTALAGARRLGDPATLAVALESRQNALLDVAHLDERLALSEELLALARSVGDAELEALALHRRVYNLLEAGRTGDALAARTQLERVADDLRQPLFQHWATCWMAVWAQLAGDFDAASELAARALALGRRAPSGNPRNTTYPGQLLAIAYWRDELGPSAAVIAGHVERNPHLSIYRAALGLAYLQAGERDRAVTEFESQAADGFRGIAHDMNWFTAVCLLAELCARIGDTERASLLYALLAPHRHKVAVVTSIGCWGPAERYLGLLAATRGDSERAVEHFEAALARAASCGMLHPLARMREEYARAARPVNPVVRPRTRR